MHGVQARLPAAFLYRLNNQFNGTVAIRQHGPYLALGPSPWLMAHAPMGWNLIGWGPLI